MGRKNISMIQMSISNLTSITVNLNSLMAKTSIFYIKTKGFGISVCDSCINFCSFRNQRNLYFNTIFLNSLDDASINETLLSI